MFGQLVNESTLPIRKRRRPALACIECRRRKIKCDRNHPCYHCKQTKNVSCAYKDHHPTISNRRLSNSSPAVSQAIEHPSHALLDGVYNNELSYRIPSIDSSPRSDLIIPNYPESEKGSNASPLATTIDDAHSQQDEQVIADRIRKLAPDAMNGASEEEIRGTRWQRAMGINFSTFNDVIVEDGPPKARLRTKFFNQSDHTPIKELRGSISKTRFFGPSHWMNSFEQFHRICSFKEQILIKNDQDPYLNEANAEVRRLLEKCKTTARKIKAERSVQWHMNPDFKSYIPARDIADKLVHLYLRTMESNYRILHIPQFLREYEGYWNNSAKAPQSSVVKILLVMAIGTCFYQEPDSEALRAEAQQWVYSAQSWVYAPFEKGRLNLSGLQVHCLLLLARQICAIGGDLIWVAAGTLLRTAFQMGFHLDPSYFPKMSIMHAELRRRLWATVLEMTVQTSLGVGMPPLVTANDYNTAPPANINDEDITETTVVQPIPKPPHVFTQSSMQIQLLKSINTRLTISTVLNNFHSELSYDLILRLGSDISEALKSNQLLVKSYPSSLPHPTALHRNLLDIFTRRFLMAVHWPFALKSQTDPRYYFSRKVCSDVALIIISHSGKETPTSSPILDASGNEIMDDYSQLYTMGGGCFKEIISHAGLIACLELIMQLEEQAGSGLPASASSVAAREPLRQAVRDIEVLIAKRIQFGENNVKGLLFMQAAQGQIEALEKGGDPEKAIVEAARIGAKKCLELLRARSKCPVTPSDAGIDVNTTDAVDGSWQSEILNGEPDYGYDFMMQDGSPESGMSNFNFDIPDSWLFSGWGDNGDL